MIEYLRDPERIHQQNDALLRELLVLDAFTEEQQQVVIQMVLAYGDPSLVESIRFSERALAVAHKAIKLRNNLLYDVELVNQALSKRLLYQEPFGFLGKASVI
ncbi:MAG: precorrin-8X methylmutase, partial [Thiothrix litoralis]